MTHEINDKDLSRPLNYIIVNSEKDYAYENSISIAKLYLKNDPRLKVILHNYNADFNTISYQAVMSKKTKGKIYQIKPYKEPVNEMLYALITKLKYCMLITSSKEFQASDYNLFINERIEKKSIDILIHKPDISLTGPELELIRKIETQGKNKEVNSRNIYYRIYPNPEFDINFEKFKSDSNRYGKYHTLGLYITQLAVNINSDKAKSELYESVNGNLNSLNHKVTSGFVNKFAYYNFFSKKISGVDNETIIKASKIFKEQTGLSHVNIDSYIQFVTGKKPLTKLNIDDINNKTLETVKNEPSSKIDIDEVVKNAIAELQMMGVTNEQTIDEFYKAKHKQIENQCTYAEFEEKIEIYLKNMLQKILKTQNNKI